jgi:putative endopeptidase
MFTEIQDLMESLYKDDSHSTPLHRVNMPISNLDAWYEAYSVKSDDAMYISPEKRVSIW